MSKKTLVFKVNPDSPEDDLISQAASIIRRGGLVAFPTETVYGLGADALNPTAVSALFEAKMRPRDNPPIVHVGSIEDVYKLAENVPDKAFRLMEFLWPGPLTIILKRSRLVPDVTAAGLDTIAVRMPRHSVALALIRKSGSPIAAPSANLAGRPSPTTAQHVLEDLEGRIDAILDAGPTHIGVESTVLDMTVDPPQILRPGGVPYEVLKSFLWEVTLHPVATSDMELHLNHTRSPGIKHKHYAPKAEMFLVEGSLKAVVRKINELAEDYRRIGHKVGVLATDETSSSYKADVVKSLGSRSNLAEIAKNLFRLLRDFDSEGVDVILAESIPTDGLGLAVMNRLRKASGYKILRVNE
ncbi:MAG: L-threonylcarbamoyladenylate synthase [Candidatus Bathyarchaeota archaeon]|nr:L-threonylcarbamoyladenylate synthase [Candidatus Bathyarchaeota archaeon]